MKKEDYVMKRLTAMLLSGVLVLSVLAGCSGGAGQYDNDCSYYGCNDSRVDGNQTAGIHLSGRGRDCGG